MHAKLCSMTLKQNEFSGEFFAGAKTCLIMSVKYILALSDSVVCLCRFFTSQSTYFSVML